MTQRVVDGLELVEVQAEHGKPLAFRRLLQAGFDLRPQLDAVRQSGERIVMGQECEPLLRISLFGDVDVYGDAAAGAQRRADDRYNSPILQFLLENPRRRAGGRRQSRLDEVFDV